MDQALNFGKLIKRKAQQKGFLLCGFTSIKDSKLQNQIITIKNSLSKDAQEAAFSRWLQKGYHASMSWLEKNLDKRQDPSLLVPGVKTIIVLADSYSDGNKDLNHPIAMYARGLDYHHVFKQRMLELLNYIKRLEPKVEGRVFTDSAPIVEHYWAQKAGIGWTGKNTLTINKNFGSYFYLGEIFINIDLPQDTPEINRCGTCDKCLKTCPTGALIEPGVLDSRKCISFLTIENKEAFTYQQTKAVKNHIWGFDICQQVCPWNKKEIPVKLKDYGSLDKDFNDLDTLKHLLNMPEGDFKNKFKLTPLIRAKKSGIERNIAASWPELLK